jgi:hypothetical protein
VNDSLTRLVPSAAKNFLIHVPTLGNRSFNLKLYIRTEIANNELLHPPSSKIFLQWDVILPSQTWGESRVEWIIDKNQSVDNAFVTFMYANTDAFGNDNEYSVDVYLNSQFGNKISSLAPGGNSTVKMAFGYQVVLFRYWISNPNNPGTHEEIGWVQKKPNGSTYGLVLNSYNEAIDFDIPAYFEVYTQEHGFIKIHNKTKKDLFIRANGQMLENFIVLPQGSSTTGMSYIASEKISPDYKIPIGDYLFVAIYPNSGQEIGTVSTEIDKDELFEWIIE